MYRGRLRTPAYQHEKHDPRHSQTGHTWHKSALSHLFSDLLGIYTPGTQNGLRNQIRASTQSVFRCTNCDHEANADVNAAENIRRQGVEILARAGNSSLSVPPTLAVNKRNKTRLQAVSRCTHELALLKQWRNFLHSAALRQNSSPAFVAGNHSRSGAQAHVDGPHHSPSQARGSSRSLRETKPLNSRGYWQTPAIAWRRCNCSDFWGSTGRQASHRTNRTLYKNYLRDGEPSGNIRT